MKLKRMLELLRPQEELIAAFGQAQLGANDGRQNRVEGRDG